MGFGVPGALGAQLGSGRRPLVLCGDGAFQMTGPEIAQAPRYGLNPIVLVLNNGGWQIFRPVVPRSRAARAAALALRRAGRPAGAARASRVRRADELRDALAAAARARTFVVIEAMVPPDDQSPVSRKYIRASARRGGARR